MTFRFHVTNALCSVFRVPTTNSNLFGMMYFSCGMGLVFIKHSIRECDDDMTPLIITNPSTWLWLIQKVEHFKMTSFVRHAISMESFLVPSSLQMV